MDACNYQGEDRKSLFFSPRQSVNTASEGLRTHGGVNWAGPGAGPWRVLVEAVWQYFSMALAAPEHRRSRDETFVTQLRYSGRICNNARCQGDARAASKSPERKAAFWSSVATRSARSRVLLRDLITKSSSLGSFPVLRNWSCSASKLPGLIV